MTVKNSREYTLGGNTYKLAVTTEQLEKVRTTIDEKNISQYHGGAGHCDEIANYHIYMLQGRINLNKASLNDCLNRGDDGGSPLASYSEIKEAIDDGYPVRIHSYWKGLSYPRTGEHWVTAVGYKGNCTSLGDLLILSSYYDKSHATDDLYRGTTINETSKFWKDRIDGRIHY